ncbi:WD40 repeat-containing protein [Heterostelium album PN500]|uniref:WD40 repeat-containing protein n=1 Tax=Heterostelium pallidum (strain ATCC 26659 / Pp 5 / PN500) TaxID=670386 RepID=D3B5R3_HETP5|nr:WD40 repeat-containing protein [Heterostelium album PN500]EFA83211.1 WD40 repeat-containing protein [Heterostelium album PN500]|eukprot:XP_020435328.1 WD40 repeat-containing protein [Heterostelium album PN500]
MEYHLQSSVIHSIENEDVCYITQCDSRSSKYIAAVGSNNIVKLYDQTSHSIISVLKGHTDTIHQAKFIDDSTLITCSSDRTIRIFNCDTATQIKCIQQKEEVFSFDISGDIMAVAAGLTVVILDTKTWKQIRCFDCHTGDVTRVMFHPNAPNKLFSCSMDGLINLYDLSIQDDDDAILYVMNGEHSVSTFGFFGASNQLIWSLSTTERLSIWSVEEGTRLREYGDLRTILAEKNNQLEVNYFITCYYDQPSNNLYLFGGDFSGTGLLFQVTDDQVLPIGRLQNGHTELIRTMTWNKDVCINTSHNNNNNKNNNNAYATNKSLTTIPYHFIHLQQKDHIMTTGEDGRLCFWINQTDFKNELQQSPSTRNQSKITKSNTTRSNPYAK